MLFRILLALIGVAGQVGIAFGVTMSVPASQQSYVYPPVADPVLSEDPAAAQPVGVGGAATGGDTFTIQVSLPAFPGPVDIYVGIQAPAIGPYFWIVRSDGSLASPTEGLEPWRSHVSGPVSETIFQDVPIGAVPLGAYHLYVAVTPAGDFSGLFLWRTHFTAGVGDDAVAEEVRSVVSAVLGLEGNVGAALSATASGPAGFVSVDPSVLRAPKTPTFVIEPDGTIIWQYADEVIDLPPGGTATIDGELYIFGSDTFGPSTWTHESFIFQPLGPFEVILENAITSASGLHVPEQIWMINGWLWEQMNGHLKMDFLLPGDRSIELLAMDSSWTFTSSNRQGLFPGDLYVELFAESPGGTSYVIDELELTKRASGGAMGGIPELDWRCTGYVKWHSEAGGRGSCRIAGDCSGCR